MHISYIGDKSFTKVTRAMVTVPQLSSNEESFVAIGTFCHN